MIMVVSQQAYAGITLLKHVQASGQDGGIGRYASLPHTTKRRITTNLKIKNQNCQKIELYGSLTTKELKKKHSFRPVEGAETGGEDLQQSGSWWSGQGGGWHSGWPHICMRINREEQLGSKTDLTTQASSPGK